MRHPVGNIVLAGWILAAALAAAGATAAPATPAAAARKTPEATAQALFQAWKQKSRKAALRVATREATTKLFDVRWRAMQFRGCTPRGEEGGFECVYLDGSLDLSLAMVVEGGASLGGFNVSSLSFSSEE